MQEWVSVQQIAERLAIPTDLIHKRILSTSLTSFSCRDGNQLLIKRNRVLTLLNDVRPGELKILNVVCSYCFPVAFPIQEIDLNMANIGLQTTLPTTYESETCIQAMKVKFEGVTFKVFRTGRVIVFGIKRADRLPQVKATLNKFWRVHLKDFVRTRNVKI